MARRKVELFARHHLVLVDLTDVLAAIDLHVVHGLAFWDALIVAAAKHAGCRGAGPRQRGRLDRCLACAPRPSFAHGSPMKPAVSLPTVVAAAQRLVARAEAGECIVITRHGRPVAQVFAVAEKQAIPYGDLAGRGIEMADDLSLPEAVIADFEGSEA